MRDIRNWYKLLEGQGLAAGDSGPGAAQGTLSANVAWLPFYSPPRSTITVSGTLSPDATGSYPLTGIFNSNPYFKRTTGAYYIWTDFATGLWYLSSILGTPGADHWWAFALIDAAWIPVGLATGTPATTCPYALPYDQKGVIIGPSVSRITSMAAGGFPAAQGSIEMLVRPYWNNADGLRHVLWDTYYGNNRRFILHKYSDNLTTLQTDSTARGAFSFPWTAHQLYHVVLNWGTNKLYINGILRYTFTPGGLGLGASTLYIGDRYTSADYSFNGIVYYFIARDAALTLAEIAAFRSFFETQYIPQP